MEELQHIYEERGLPVDLAKEVAMHLTKNDAVLAHARDELNIDPDELANPGQARCLSFRIPSICAAAAQRSYFSLVRRADVTVSAAMHLVDCTQGAAPSCSSEMQDAAAFLNAMMLLRAGGSCVGYLLLAWRRHPAACGSVHPRPDHPPVLHLRVVHRRAAAIRRDRRGAGRREHAAWLGAGRHWRLASALPTEPSLRPLLTS